MVKISPTEQEKMLKDFQPDNEGLNPLQQTWGITGERKYFYYRDAFLLVVFSLPLGISFWAWSSTKPRTSAHQILSITTLILAVLAVAYLIYRILRGWTTPQLRWKEVKAAKQSSEENQKELLTFAEELKKNGPKAS